MRKFYRQEFCKERKNVERIYKFWGNFVRERILTIFVLIRTVLLMQGLTNSRVVTVERA